MDGRKQSLPESDVAVVIMAAGKGTRMKNPNLAKVMYELNGRPMIHYVVDLAYDLHACRVIVIVGYQREAVEDYIRRSHPDVECAVQEQQLGTGHAVMQAEKLLQSFAGDVLVLSGDVPLLKKPTMDQLLRHHRDSRAIATILTADMEDPTGYGRIVRNEDQSVKKIVEHKDALPEELAIQEINSGIYAFDKGMLFDGLAHITSHNVQNEFYLTDVFEYFWKHHGKVSALKALQLDEIRGINTVTQLDEAMKVLESRQPG
ncbi:MAG: Bifunctional protein glmU [Bacteroidetes bacterium]|nr:Bifunctional protein glmU [Bacteroidota bacterium]